MTRGGTGVLVVALALGCGAADGRGTGPAWMGDASTGEADEDDADDADDAGSTSSGGEDGPGSSPGSSPATGDGTATDPDPGGSSSSSGGGGESSSGSSLCDDIAGEDFLPPSTCDGPGGNTSTEMPTNGLFSTSWFGCYRDDNGTIIEDPYDNCEFACGSQGLCDASQSGPECEADLQWFAADADRFGCGGRIRVTNCDNGNSVILVTLDRGPNCNSVEMSCGAPVLDMSHDAMIHLFDDEYGGCDLQAVVVEPVADDTPLGPE